MNNVRVDEYWGCSKLPYNAVPDPDFFYPSVIHKEALARVNFAIEYSQGLALLTGEVGSGKTMLSRLLINEMSEEEYDVALLVNPLLSADNLLKEILYQLGVENSTNVKIDLIHALNKKIWENTKTEKNTIIIIDEAQLIEEDIIFEELRLLLNFHTNDKFLITLILIGQTELKEKITRLPQLDQRVLVRYHLGVLNKKDTYKYIAFRLNKCGIDNIFSQDAYSLIYENSQGNPRKINNICNLGMAIGAFSGKKLIDKETIEKAIEANT